MSGNIFVHPDPGPLRRYELPLPPSANVYWRHRNNPDPRKPPLVHVSTEGREYQKRVAQLILRQRNPRLEGLVAVRVAMWLERDTGDTDNRIKPLLDALEHAEVFQPKPPKKQEGDKTQVKPWGDRQVVLIEAYRAGVAPLVPLSEEELEEEHEKALRKWKRQAKKKPGLKRPKYGARRNRRRGVVLVEIESYDWPYQTVKDFKAEHGWE